MKRLFLVGLVCLMLLCGLMGCTGPGEDITAEEPTPTPTAEPTPTPIPTPDTPVTPEVVVTTPQAGAQQQTEDVTVQVHGEDEVISMSDVSGSFASAGGPSFTLPVDKQRYQINDVGGYCYITLRTGMSGDVYAELGFRANTAAADIGTGILDEYGFMSTKEDLGTEQLGSNTVRHIRGETVQNVFDVYLLDTRSGCVTMVLCTTSETKAHHDRLTAFLEGLEIIE